MRKILESFFILFLFTLVSNIFISGCGSEIDKSGNRKIKVSIPFDLSEKSFQKPNQINYSNLIYGPAPSNIRSIRVEVLYPNGVKISSQVDVAGGTYVEVNMELDEGTNIFFYAFAYDGPAGTGNLLYTGLSSPQKLEMNKAYEILIHMVTNDATPPTVSSVSPANGATGVPSGTASGVITIIFSKLMDPSTINSSTIYTTPAIALSINYSGTTATCTPSSALSPNTTYTITITTGVKDITGNTMSSSYLWSFTTGADGGGGGGGTSPPTAFSFSLPLNGETGVSLTPTLSWADSIGETSYTIEIAKDAAFTMIAHSATVGADIISYTVPTTQSLSSSTNYFWMVKAVNSYGATTASNAPFTFTTTSGGDGGGGDTTPPTVSSVSPANGATSVPSGTASGIITIIFSETMASSTLTTSTITLSPNPGYSVNYSGGTTATVVPTTLNPSTIYTVTVTTGVKDVAGNAMASSYSWSFDTTLVDNIPPGVSSVIPSLGATGVATNTSIAVIFNEAMNSSTITTSTFTISGGVTGSISYSGKTATFTPSSNLSYNTTYTVTITTGVKDVAGNAMTSNYTWSFTTGTSSDTTPPSVSSVTPINGATGVPSGTATGIITIIFSETMDSSSLTTSTITLSPNPGYSVNYSGGSSTTATVVPTTFSSGTTYTVTITTGVKDSSGNAMANPYSWSFTTEGGGDTTPPTVSSVSPSSGATGVAVNTYISATFSEAMNSSTITISTFTMSGGVTGSVSYAGKSATFAPSVSLSQSTAYTATITTGVKDAAGNAMTSNYTWSFTTGASADTTPPTVSSVSPSSGATGVPSGTATGIITIIFSETLDPTSLTTSTITLSPNPGYSVNYSGGSSTTATIVPTTFSSGTTYTVTITGVKDSSGNAMASPYSWSFTTQ